jgi:hypothetical protein
MNECEAYGKRTNNLTFSLSEFQKKKKKNCGAEKIVKEKEHLLSMCEAFGSVSRTTRKEKKEGRERGKEERREEGNG